MNPLDYIARIFWSFFKIFLLFAQTLFAPSKPSAVLGGEGGKRKGGGFDGGDGGPRIHRV